MRGFAPIREVPVGNPSPKKLQSPLTSYHIGPAILIRTEALMLKSGLAVGQTGDRRNNAGVVAVEPLDIAFDAD